MKKYNYKNENGKFRYNYLDKKVCPDCGKLITNISSRCKSCSNINRTGTFSRENIRGNKSHFWKGGKDLEHRPAEYSSRKLREAIRKRDNYRCQQCFRHQDELFTSTGKKIKLSIHHIDYNKSNNNPKNLIALCKNCHDQTNFNRQDWIDYLQDKIQGV